MLIGTDIAEISRFENMSDAFLKKCFNDDEVAFFKGKKAAATAAADFAAKEAFSKALGTGIRGFNLRDISVLRDDLGKPYFRFEPKVADILKTMGAESVELSLSHDGGVAVAVAVINQNDKMCLASKVASKAVTEVENVISYNMINPAIHPRCTETHKGDYGRILIVAGSKGLTGAGILASKAAIRSGGGLVTLGCCESLNSIFETCLHEVMTMPLADNGVSLSRECASKVVDKANASSVVAFGPGLTASGDTYFILKEILRNVKKPVVIDADGINVLAKNINILKKAQASVVLTPHMGEFARLTGLSVEEILKDVENIASEFAVRYNVTLVLKSHKTLVATADGQVRTNLLGNPGMATGGSGDVLTGVIASFIGQGIENAVECGVFIHSMAADMAAFEKGEYGMIPTDIIDNIPCAIKYICGKE